jgi:hypothetical protein
MFIDLCLMLILHDNDVVRLKLEPNLFLLFFQETGTYLLTTSVKFLGTQ